MKKYLSLLLLVLSISALGAGNNLKVEISGKEVLIGEQFTLNISLETGPDVEPFISFDPRNAELIDDNSNDNSRVMIKGVFAGGKLIQKKIYNYKYTFQPVRAGHAYVRNIKVDLGAKVLRHRTMSIKVITKARNLGKYVLRAEVDQEEVYVGQGVELNYYLYFQGNIAQPDVRKFPKLKDFLKRFELPRRNVERAELNGKIYKRLLIYRAKLYPLKEGKLSVDPVEVAFQYPDIKRGRRDVFGGMSMNFSTSTYKSKTMRSPRVKINVKPLPVEGMPKNFTGLVGDHDFNLTFTSERILVNDILEARLEVSGEGALERFDPIKFLRSDGFEEFEAKTEIVEMGNLINKKVIDYTFLGKRSVKLPASSFSVSIFDPVQRKYIEKEISIPELQVFGSGSSSEVIKKKDSSDEIKTSTTKKVESFSVVGPLTSNSFKSSLFNLRWINLILFSFIVLIIISDFSFTISFKRAEGLTTLKKSLNYKNLHDFIISYGGPGATIREKIKNAEISKEAELYLNDLLEKAEKNEYNGSRNKLVFNRNYIEELLKANAHEND